MLTLQSVPPVRAILPRFIVSVLSQMHAPYIWNAKGDLHHGRRVFDCSGLVTWAYRQAGGSDLRATHNSDKLWASFPAVSLTELRTGDLLFYGMPAKEGQPEDPEHVAVYLGAGVVISAGGGGRNTKTLEEAARAGAMVRAEASIRYRKDLLGARRLPWAGEETEP